jgi:hypothetical protein
MPVPTNSVEEAAIRVARILKCGIETELGAPSAGLVQRQRLPGAPAKLEVSCPR